MQPYDFHQLERSHANNTAIMPASTVAEGTMQSHPGSAKYSQITHLLTEDMTFSLSVAFVALVVEMIHPARSTATSLIHTTHHKADRSADSCLGHVQMDSILYINI